jgi:hypothetical protein
MVKRKRRGRKKKRTKRGEDVKVNKERPDAGVPSFPGGISVLS